MPEEGDNFYWWAFGNAPMWLNFSDPTILNLDNTTWKPNYVVIASEADQTEDWVYMVVTAPLHPPAGAPSGEQFWPVAHPVYLCLSPLMTIPANIARCICMAMIL